MSITLQRKPQGIEQLHRILECTLIAGSCVTHQRLMDKPRKGCPLADSMMRQSGRSR